MRSFFVFIQLNNYRGVFQSFITTVSGNGFLPLLLHNIVDSAIYSTIYSTKKLEKLWSELRCIRSNQVVFVPEKTVSASFTFSIVSPNGEIGRIKDKLIMGLESYLLEVCFKNLFSKQT
jgi:hypothetical protein